MAMMEINWKPSRRELRQFGLLCLLVFGGFAASIYFRGGSRLTMQLLSAAALVGGVLGVAAPMALKPIYVGWMVAAFPIGWTVSHVLLGLIFYGLLTPLGLLMRVVGYDPMHRGFDRDAKSYWIAHERPRVDRYFRQF
jgi:hypothetical protein